MSIAELQTAKRRTIGTKQTIKMVEKGKAQKVFVAMDAEHRVLSPLLELCEKKGIPVVKLSSMLELGKACGIDVGSASAAIVGDL